MPVSTKTLTTEDAVDMRQARLCAAQDMVVRDPEILSGTPVIRGTRVPVYTIAAWVEDGETIDTILDSYPSVTKEQVELAAIFAKAFPYDEKPRKPFQLPPGATLIYAKTFPFHKGA